MKKQAAEAKPETKDIKAEEQKPKVPAPQWAGVGEPFRENLETSDPGLSNQPQLYLCKRWFQECPETSEPNSTSFAHPQPWDRPAPQVDPVPVCITFRCVMHIRR